MLPPVPYKGDAPYIFVSYAHRDSERVWPIIARMQADGYRVWYDEGIDPGTEWDENIAMHVTACGFFLAFLSENYMASDNCKDELNFSRDQGKQQVLVYLERVQLPKGMAMRMGRTPSLQYGLSGEEERFYEALYQCAGVQSFFGENAAPKRRQKKSSKTFHAKKKRTERVFLLLLAMLLIGGGLYAAISGIWRQWVPQQETPPEQTQPQITEQTAPQPITNWEIFDDEKLKITVLELELQEDSLILHLAIRNKTEETVYMCMNHCYFNGVGLKMSWAKDCYYQETTLTQITWDRQILEKAGIDPENITVVELHESGDLQLGYLTYYPYGEAYAQYQSFVPGENDQLILDAPEYQVYFLGSHYEMTVEGYMQWVEELVLVNRSSDSIHINMSHTDINRYANHVPLDQVIQPGHYDYIEGGVPQSDWQATGYDRVLCHSGNALIYYVDSETGEYRDGEVPFAIYPEGEEAASVLAPRELTPEQLLLENEAVRIGYLGTVRNTQENPCHIFYVENLLEKEIRFTYGFAAQDTQTEEDVQNIYGMQIHLSPGRYQTFQVTEATLAEADAPQELWLSIDVCTIEEFDGWSDLDWLFETAIPFRREID